MRPGGTQRSRARRLQVRSAPRKLVLFSVLTVIAISLGIYWITLGDVAAPERPVEPGSVNVYTDDPEATVDVVLGADSVSRQPAVNVELAVTSLKPPSQVRWFVVLAGGFQMPSPELQSVNPVSTAVRTSSAPIYRSDNQIVGRAIVVSGTVTDLTGGPFRLDTGIPQGRPNVISVGVFPSTSLGEINTAGSAFSAPGIQDPMFQPTGEVMAGSEACGTLTTPSGIEVGPPPTPAECGDQVPTHVVAFSPPRQLFASVNAPRGYLNGRVVFSSPTMPQVNLSDELLWHAEGSLAPSLQTESIDYADEKAANDFYAGLAFATAAATFVAAVQEIRGRRRSVSAATQSATPSDSSSNRPVVESELYEGADTSTLSASDRRRAPAWQPEERGYL